ncbi:MAG: sterol desaturase family protein [Actinomycetota bacterium]
MTATTTPPEAPIEPPGRRPRRWPLWLFRLALVGVVLSGVLVQPDELFVIPLLFVLVVPFEKWFPRHDQPIRRPHLGTDLAYAVAAPSFAVVTIATAVVVGVASLAWVPGLALRPLVTALPDGLRLAFGVVLFDLAAYWVHRWSHEWPLLWKVHSIHHSTRHLDWISGLRVHPLDGALIAPPFVLLLAAGFDAEEAGIFAVVQIVAGLFFHANVRWRLRPLHRIVSTPEFHHWHHSIEREAYCSNYAAFLPVWDQLFGTYFMPKDRRPQAYGVTDPVPDGMAGQLLYPLRGEDGLWVRLRHPVRSARQLLGTARRALGRSGKRVGNAP